MPSEEEMAYMIAHQADSKVAAVIACSAICATFATLFVILRIISRRITFHKFKLEASDWFLIVAWVCI